MSSYKYISKDPCGEDLFAGKVHERTADHIASLLRTEGSLIIGIDGGWGAGKSNLIQMVEKKLMDKLSFLLMMHGDTKMICLVALYLRSLQVR